MVARKRRPVLVGVTGGIGSGKSTVCRLFAEKGRVAFSTDRIAQNLLRSHPRIRSDLVKAFGSGITNGGRLDKHKLASIVFKSPRKLRKLNSIVHPLVLKDLKRRINALSSRPIHSFVLIESALIFEAGLENRFDSIILVHAPLKTRIKRASSSLGIPQKEVLRRARNQINPAEAKKKADFVIRNTENIPKLRKIVRFLDSLLSKRYSFSFPIHK